jgi:hypothetical protein
LGVIRIFLRTFPFHEIELFIPKVTHKLISRTSANPTFRGCKVFCQIPQHYARAIWTVVVLFSWVVLHVPIKSNDLVLTKSIIFSHKSLCLGKTKFIQPKLSNEALSTQKIY